jgi:LysR family carnitine catabolism transcriptional activator
MDFSSRQLRAFLLVARHRSFTRAADDLFITPSGLSLLIRELESQLGVRLFDRTTRNVSLTSYGSALVPVIRRNLQDLESALSQLGRVASVASQSMSIGAPPLVAANLLPQLIKEFGQYRPEVRVSVFDANLSTIMQRVEAGKLDFGVGIFKNTAGMIRKRLFRFSLVLIRPGSQPAALHATTTWSAITAERLIAFPPESPVQRAIERHLRQTPARKIEPIMVVNSLDTQIAMVAAGQGVAIIPSFGLAACRNRDVVASRLVSPSVTMDFHEIRNRGRKLSQAADEFSSFIQAQMMKWAGHAGVI